MAAIHKYRIDRKFETYAVYYAATDSKFYHTVGKHLVPDMISNPACALVLRAVHAIFQDTGNVPSTTSVTLQRVHSWHVDGKVTTQQMRHAAVLLDSCLDDEVAPNVVAVRDELVPVLRRVAEQEALHAAVKLHAAGEDVQGAVDALAKANRLGSVDLAGGVTFSRGAFDVLANNKKAETLPLGVAALDYALDGGVPRGSLCFFIAETGGGKSIMLNHIAAHAMQTRRVAYATLELSEVDQMARFMAAVFDIPTSQLYLEAGREKAMLRWESLQRTGVLRGSFDAKYFPAKVTSALDVIEWAESLEKRPEVLIVDYADKLCSPLRGDDSEYRAMQTVYEGLRLYAADNELWCFTASQPKDTHGKKLIDVNDAADSRHKGRVADLVITLNKTDELGFPGVKFYIAKNRHGVGGLVVGPEPPDWASGRIVNERPFVFSAADLLEYPVVDGGADGSGQQV